MSPRQGRLQHGGRRPPQNFFWVVDIGGGPRLCSSRPIRGARHRRTPEPIKAPAATWRCLLIAGPGLQYLEGSNRSRSKAFQLPTGPCARAPGRRDELRAAAIGRRRCGGCRRAAGLKFARCRSLCRSLPRGLLLRGREHVGHPSRRMHRLRGLRARISGRSIKPDTEATLTGCTVSRCVW